jgi:hypothetical protein
MYNSPLLDEIHYYFPALIYEPELFQSTADVFAYIQYQMRQRYDLFSVNLRGHARMGRLPWEAAAAAAPRPAAPAPPRFPPAGPLGGGQRPARPIRTPLEEIHVTLDTFDMADPLIGGLIGGGGALGHTLGTQNLELLTALMNLTAGRAPAGAGAAAGGAAAGVMDPVIVRPTAAQIDAGTTLEIVDAEEDVCAICQDTMEAGSQARAIHACDHRFHVGCIDTWFQRNVRCPVCRHDIRDPPADDTDVESTGSIS